jgi:membrane protein
MINDSTKKVLRARARVHYRRANRASQGVLGILVDAVHSFSEARAAEAAASIAYYALFSLFPLLFFVVAIGSSILKNPQIQQQVLTFVTDAFPAARELVQINMEHMLEIRGAVGLAGTIGLLWSSTAVFTALARNVNRAWRGAGARNFLKGRLVALVIAGSLLGLLMIVSILLITLFNLLPQLSVPLLGDISIYRTLVWRVLSRMIPWLLIYAMFLLLYWWVPNTKVKWSEANWGALVATFAWEINRASFVWYLNTVLAWYQLVYGSLGVVVALMLWIYVSSLIALFGAHLSAAIAHHNRPRPEQKGLAKYQTYLKPQNNLKPSRKIRSKNSLQEDDG